MPGLIVTGTDTEVGKTYFSCQLVRALRESGGDVVGYKPVCCGERTDAELLLAAADGVEPLEVVNPVWYQAPVAPGVAAELEGKPVATPGSWLIAMSWSCSKERAAGRCP